MDDSALEELLRPLLEYATDLGDRVEKIEQVAGGSFAEVWRGALSHGAQTQEVALKILRRHTAPTDKLLVRLRNEVKVWSRLQHENLLAFLGITTTWGIKELCMVSPWQRNGTAISYLKAHYEDNGTGHALTVNLILGISQGLKYLHNQIPSAVVHGDIKGNNVLVADDGHPLLADFGLSTVVEDVDPGMTSMLYGGSMPWMAPERMDPGKFGLDTRSARGPASDIWSFGMTVYEILSGERPFGKTRPYELIAAIVNRDERPPPLQEYRCSFQDFRKLMPLVERCYATDRMNRPSASDVVEVLTSPPERPPPWATLQNHVIRGSPGRVPVVVLPPSQEDHFRSGGQDHFHLSAGPQPGGDALGDSQQTLVGDWYYGGGQSQFSQGVDEFYTAPNSQFPQSQQWGESQQVWDESQREVMFQVIPEGGESQAWE